MGQATDFEGINKVLVAPKGDEDRVGSIGVFNNGHATVTAWEFTPEEVEQINRTGRVYVAVLAGPTSPPIFVGSADTVRFVVQDFGGSWKGRE